MVILEVPEFQYDIVKSRGAVWDANIKKWCADRKHLNALCEWIPNLTIMEKKFRV